MGLQVVPVTIKDARRFVGEHHRHNLAPRSGLFAAGVSDDVGLVGVAIVGRPVARMLQDGRTCEVLRVATDGTRNACSMLYGAVRRAAFALGYQRIVTYTLTSESGASLRAAGWVREADLPARPTWDGGGRHRVQADLFGNERRPSCPKVRWSCVRAGGA